MTRPRRHDRVLVISQFYEPEPNFITADVAARLARESDVVVLAPHPNYPLDSVYPGTRWPWLPSKTVEHGVTVWRFPVLAYHGRSHLRRALCYLSFALPAMLLAPFLAGHPRVVWVYLGPFFAALAALPFRLVGSARLVYTCADLWPESLVAAGVVAPGVKVRALLAYRRTLNRLADCIICSTRGILERFASEGVPRERLRYVPVWVRDARAGDDGAPWERASTFDADGLAHIVYAGNLGPAQRLDTLILAAEELQRERAAVVFDVYGSGSEERALRRMAGERGLANVRFHGRVTARAAFDASARAFGQVVCLEPSPLFAMTVPSKLSACCAAGAPLLFGLTGEARELAAASGGGLPFEAGQPESLAAAVRRLLSLGEAERGRMSANLKRFHRQHFDADILLEQSCGVIRGT
jgi:colanic acid biosynthesis glycosyl transferase WcaI